MNTYFIEWTSEGCSIKGALVIAESAGDAEQMVRAYACPDVQEVITLQPMKGPQIWMLGELD